MRGARPGGRIGAAALGLAALGLAALGATEPGFAAEPPAWPRWVDLSRGQDIDEGYRAEFGRCDTEGTFRGEDFSTRMRCSDDPNQVTALRRLPGGAVVYVSKLSVDFDGSRSPAARPATAPTNARPA
jgi:hypothetical protein